MDDSVVDSSMLSSCKKKCQRKRLISQLIESLSDRGSGHSTHRGIHVDETVGPQNDGFVYDFKSVTLGKNSASHNQVNERNVRNKIRKEVDSIVTDVKNRFHDAFLEHPIHCCPHCLIHTVAFLRTRKQTSTFQDVLKRAPFDCLH